MLLLLIAGIKDTSQKTSKDKRIAIYPRYVHLWFWYLYPSTSISGALGSGGLGPGTTISGTLGSGTSSSCNTGTQESICMDLILIPPFPLI